METDAPVSDPPVENEAISDEVENDTNEVEAIEESPESETSEVVEPEQTPQVEPTYSLEDINEIRKWWEIPCVAHFCSLFRAAFDLPDFDIEELEEALLSSGTPDGSMLMCDLLSSLLNGCYGRHDIRSYNFELYLKDIFKQRWLIELEKPNPLDDSSFQMLPVRTKLELLQSLCDFRLDADDVQDLLKGLDGDNLRVEPMGKDQQGGIYWYFYGVRLYKEDPEIKPEDAKPKKKPKKVEKSKKKETKTEKKTGKRGRPKKLRKVEQNTEKQETPKTGRRSRRSSRGLAGKEERDPETVEDQEENKASNETSAKDEAPKETPKKDETPSRRSRRSGRRKAEEESKMEDETPNDDTPNTRRSNRRRSAREAAVEDESEEEEAEEVEEMEEDTEEEEEEEDMEQEEDTSKNNLDLSSGLAKTAVPPIRWHLICQNLEDWQNLADSFKGSAARCEKSLYRTVTEDFLPEIPRILEEKERDMKRRAIENAPRRTSGRLEEKQKQREDEEKRLAQEEEERRLILEREKHEIQKRQREAREKQRELLKVERQKAVEMRAKRAALREERAAMLAERERLLAEGLELPPELQNLDANGHREDEKDHDKLDAEQEELYPGMRKILYAIKTHDDSWPFWDPVKEEVAPDYYNIIQKPMDLMEIERKLDNREYKTIQEFHKDFQLMFDNCEKYNGDNSDFTYMARNLENIVLNKVRRLMPKKTSRYDEDEDFVPEELNYSPNPKGRPPQQNIVTGYVEDQEEMAEEEDGEGSKKSKYTIVYPALKSRGGDMRTAEGQKRFLQALQAAKRKEAAEEYIRKGNTAQRSLMVQTNTQALPTVPPRPQAVEDPVKGIIIQKNKNKVQLLSKTVNISSRYNGQQPKTDPPEDPELAALPINQRIQQREAQKAKNKLGFPKAEPISDALSIIRRPDVSQLYSGLIQKTAVPAGHNKHLPATPPANYSPKVVHISLQDFRRLQSQKAKVIVVPSADNSKARTVIHLSTGGFRTKTEGMSLADALKVEQKAQAATGIVETKDVTVLEKSSDKVTILKTAPSNEGSSDAGESSTSVVIDSTEGMDIPCDEVMQAAENTSEQPVETSESADNKVKVEETSVKPVLKTTSAKDETSPSDECPVPKKKRKSVSWSDNLTTESPDTPTTKEKQSPSPSRSCLYKDGIRTRISRLRGRSQQETPAKDLTPEEIGSDKTIRNGMIVSKSEVETDEKPPLKTYSKKEPERKRGYEFDFFLDESQIKKEESRDPSPPKLTKIEDGDNVHADASDAPPDIVSEEASSEVVKSTASDVKPDIFADVDLESFKAEEISGEINTDLLRKKDFTEPSRSLYINAAGRRKKEPPKAPETPVKDDSLCAKVVRRTKRSPKMVQLTESLLKTEVVPAQQLVERRQPGRPARSVIITATIDRTPPLFEDSESQKRNEPKPEIRFRDVPAKVQEPVIDLVSESNVNEGDDLDASEQISDPTEKDTDEQLNVNAEEKLDNQADQDDKADEEEDELAEPKKEAEKDENVEMVSFEEAGDETIAEDEVEEKTSETGLEVQTNAPQKTKAEIAVQVETEEQIEDETCTNSAEIAVQVQTASEGRNEIHVQTEAQYDDESTDVQTETQGNERNEIEVQTEVLDEKETNTESAEIDVQTEKQGNERNEIEVQTEVLDEKETNTESAEIDVQTELQDDESIMEKESAEVQVDVPAEAPYEDEMQEKCSESDEQFNENENDHIEIDLQSREQMQEEVEITLTQDDNEMQEETTVQEKSETHEESAEIGEHVQSEEIAETCVEVNTEPQEKDETCEESADVIYVQLEGEGAEVDVQSETDDDKEEIKEQSAEKEVNERPEVLSDEGPSGTGVCQGQDEQVTAETVEDESQSYGVDKDEQMDVQQEKEDQEEAEPVPVQEIIEEGEDHESEDEKDEDVPNQLSGVKETGVQFTREISEATQEDTGKQVPTTCTAGEETCVVDEKVSPKDTGPVIQESVSDIADAEVLETARSATAVTEEQTDLQYSAEAEGTEMGEVQVQGKIRNEKTAEALIECSVDKETGEESCEIVSVSSEVTETHGENVLVEGDQETPVAEEQEAMDCSEEDICQEHTDLERTAKEHDQQPMEGVEDVSEQPLINEQTPEASLEVRKEVKEQVSIEHSVEVDDDGEQMQQCGQVSVEVKQQNEMSAGASTSSCKLVVEVIEEKIITDRSEIVQQETVVEESETEVVDAEMEVDEVVESSSNVSEGEDSGSGGQEGADKVLEETELQSSDSVRNGAATIHKTLDEPLLHIEESHPGSSCVSEASSEKDKGQVELNIDSSAVNVTAAGDKLDVHMVGEREVCERTVGGVVKGDVLEESSVEEKGKCEEGGTDDIFGDEDPGMWLGIDEVPEEQLGEDVLENQASNLRSDTSVEGLGCEGSVAHEQTLVSSEGTESDVKSDSVCHKDVGREDLKDSVKPELVACDPPVLERISPVNTDTDTCTVKSCDSGSVDKPSISDSHHGKPVNGSQTLDTRVATDSEMPVLSEQTHDFKPPSSDHVKKSSPGKRVCSDTLKQSPESGGSDKDSSPNVSPGKAGVDRNVFSEFAPSVNSPDSKVGASSPTKGPHLPSLPQGFAASLSKLKDIGKFKLPSKPKLSDSPPSDDHS